MSAKILPFIAAAIAAVSASAQTPALEFPNGRTIDLGYIDPVRKVDSILVTNPGPEPVSIISVFPSCSCTVASYPKEPIGPGDSAWLRVVFNAENRHPGTFYKTLRLRTSDAAATHTVIVKGEVKRPTRGRPPR